VLHNLGTDYGIEAGILERQAQRIAHEHQPVPGAVVLRLHIVQHVMRLAQAEVIEIESAYQAAVAVIEAD